MKRPGIATRLSALIPGCATVILALVVGYASLVSRQTMIDMARENGTHLAQATASRINAQFRATAKVTDTMAATLEDAAITNAVPLDLSRRVLLSNPGIYGSAIAFEPQAFDRGRRFFAPYAYRRGTHVRSTSLGGADYNYFAKDWYQLAMS